MTSVTSWVNKNVSIKFLNKDGDIMWVDKINVRSREGVLTKAKKPHQSTELQ